MLAQADESHSGTPGSRATCASPGIFAACHALLRRIEPSHSLGGVKYPVLTQTLNQIALDQTYAKLQSRKLSYFARKVTYELHNNLTLYVRRNLSNDCYYYFTWVSAQAILDCATLRHGPDGT